MELMSSLSSYAPDISDDVQRAIEGMPHYVEGEIEEPEQVSMAVDVSNIFADPTDLPVMFRHLLYPTQGPLPLRPPRRTSSVGFDVKPHDEQPAPREPGDELRDLEYVTDRLTAMVSVLRNHTAAVFGNVIVHLPHHEALAEFLMVTGFPTGNINAEMPGTLYQKCCLRMKTCGLTLLRGLILLWTRLTAPN